MEHKTHSLLVESKEESSAQLSKSIASLYGWQLNTLTLGDGK